jgi:hypothetical protein
MKMPKLSTDGIKKITGKVPDLSLKTGESVKDTFEGVKDIKKELEAEGILINGSMVEKVRIGIDKNLQWIEIKGKYRIRKRLTHKLWLIPEGRPYFILHVKNPETWNPNKKITVFNGSIDVTTYKKGEDDEEIEILDTRPMDNIVGGDVLSSTAYYLLRDVVFKMFEPQSKRELVIILIIGMFGGMVIGMGLMLILVSLLF